MSTLLLLALAAPAAALGDWQRFVDRQSGIAIDVPPGFSPERSGGPGGQLFSSDDTGAMLRIIGRSIAAGSFDATVADAIAADEGEGWTITFQSQTTDWAAWSASRGGTILEVRTVLVCDGMQLAIMRISYPTLDAQRYQSIAERVASSLSQDGACF